MFSSLICIKSSRRLTRNSKALSISTAKINSKLKPYASKHTIFHYFRLMIIVLYPFILSLSPPQPISIQIKPHAMNYKMCCKLSIQQNKWQARYESHRQSYKNIIRMFEDILMVSIYSQSRIKL